MAKKCERTGVLEPVIATLRVGKAEQLRYKFIFLGGGG